METWTAIDDERRALLADLRALAPDQWDEASLCEGWRVRDVVGHLVFAATSGWTDWAGGLIRQRGNLDRHIDREAVRFGSVEIPVLLEQFAATVGGRVLPPLVKSECELADIVCHGEDIRHPLGLTREVPEEVLAVAAEFLRHDRATGTPKRIQGLRLAATDQDWSLGDGPTVEGPMLSVVMAMAGRPAHLPDLTGPGAVVLAERMTATAR